MKRKIIAIVLSTLLVTGTITPAISVAEAGGEVNAEEAILASDNLNGNEIEQQAPSKQAVSIVKAEEIEEYEVDNNSLLEDSEEKSVGEDSGDISEENENMIPEAKTSGEQEASEEIDEKDITESGDGADGLTGPSSENKDGLVSDEEQSILDDETDAHILYQESDSSEKDDISAAEMETVEEDEAMTLLSSPIQNNQNVEVNRQYTGKLTKGYNGEVNKYIFSIPKDGYVQFGVYCYSSTSGSAWVNVKSDLQPNEKTIYQEPHFEWLGKVRATAGQHWLEVRNAQVEPDVEREYDFYVEYIPDEIVDKTIPVNTRITDHVTNGSDYQVKHYSFSLTKPGYVQVSVGPSEVDYQSSGNAKHWMASFDFGLQQKSFNKRYSTVFPKIGLGAGSYQINISSYDGKNALSTDDYYLFVEYVESDYWEMESNDSFSTATNIERYYDYYGTINQTSDVDYYCFQADISDNYCIEFNHDTFTSIYQNVWTLRLYGNDKILLKSVPVQSTTGLAKLEKDLSPGTYYIAISGGENIVTSHSTSVYNFNVTGGNFEAPDTESGSDQNNTNNSVSGNNTSSSASSPSGSTTQAVSSSSGSAASISSLSGGSSSSGSKKASSSKAKKSTKKSTKKKSTKKKSTKKKSTKKKSVKKSTKKSSKKKTTKK